nr:gustatory receptor [Semanotus bifasciatus]
MLFMSVFLTSSISLGESAYLIYCCQSAALAGKKMVKICIKLQGDFEAESTVRNELFRLADVARTYEPRFTAANFFVITKGTMLVLIDVAASYLVVIVQFNGVLQKINQD